MWLIPTEHATEEGAQYWVSVVYVKHSINHLAHIFKVDIDDLVYLF
jgi:hypothetical protein